jgi:cytoskeletal protein CcmA (bactofilin family)
MSKGGGDAFTIIPRDAKFAGTLVLEGVIQIDGEFEGQIITEDLLVVGADGEVRGDVNVGSIIIEGTVEGDIDAKASVRITAQGRIRGSVTTPHLIIEDTAACGGACQVLETDPTHRTPKT